MKNILLTLEKPSDCLIKSYEEAGLDKPPYAILLLEKRLTESYTINTREDEIKRKEDNGTISAYDRVPHTHYSYEHSCIIYYNEEELKENRGTYWDFIPDGLEEDFYEYTAKLIN